MKMTKINNNYYQECGVIMLPSKEKPTEGTLVLFHNLYSNKEWYLDRVLSIEMQDYLKIWAENGLLCEGEGADVKGEYQDIYILSNEEIKKGDYYELDGVIRQQPTDPVVPNIGELWGARKVIASTDESLTKLGETNKGFNTYSDVLPKIPKEFIEKYISEHNKGNIISKVLVEVEKKILSNAALGYNEYVELIHKIDNIYIPIKIEANIHQTTYQLGMPIEMDDYELDIETKIKLNQNNEINILIGQEQEALKEAAEKEFPLVDTELCRTGVAEEENLHLLGHRKSFIKGAKWQSERMYSEEDLKLWLMYRDIYLYNHYTTYLELGLPLQSVDDFIKESYEYLMNMKKNK